MDEEVDIEEGLRKWIDEVYAQLDRANHYELLGLRRTADAKDVKRAFFRVAGMVHPDRFFQKQIGRYKKIIEVLFERFSEAHDTLRLPDRRAEYDATLADDPEPPPAAKVPVDPRVAAERQKAMDALRQRFETRKGDAQKHVEAAKRAQTLGDLPGAIEIYRKALLASPNDAAIKSAIAELEKTSSERLVESHAKKAALEERFGRWAEAATSWQKVVEARPTDVDALARLANALSRAGR